MENNMTTVSSTSVFVFTWVKPGILESDHPWPNSSFNVEFDIHRSRDIRTQYLCGCETENHLGKAGTEYLKLLDVHFGFKILKYFVSF